MTPPIPFIATDRLVRTFQSLIARGLNPLLMSHRLEFVTINFIKSI